MRNYRAWMVLLVTLLCLAWTGAALGRAGGGEAFDSDDSSSSSSSSDSWSNSDSSSNSSSSSSSSHDSGSGSSSSGGANAESSSAVWIVLVLFILGYIIIQNLNKRATKQGTARANAMQTIPSTDSRQFADLQQRDPQFSAKEFGAFVGRTFMLVQKAWCERDMSKAAAVMTPAIMQRFAVQVEEMKQSGRTNHMDQLTIHAVELVEAAHDANFDYLVALISAAAADYTTDDRTGAILSGSNEPKPFSEYWTLMRSDQVKSGDAEEMKTCPKCGAPISVNAVGKCDHCGSDVTSGEFGWVLSEIVQPSMWKPRAN